MNVLDELRRLPGVGDAALFDASDHSMRILLRPEQARPPMMPGLTHLN